MYAEYHRDLIASGYEIIPVKPNGKAPINADWSNFTTKKMLKAAKLHPNASIGLLTANTPCIDVDCRNKELAKLMVDYLRPLFPQSLERVGNAPKTLFICRTEQPFTKLASKIYIDADGNKCQVEILGKGQQAVVWGNHATTGKPYHYIGNDIGDVPMMLLDTLSAAQAQGVIKRFEAFATELGLSEQNAPLRRSEGVEKDESAGWGIGCATDDEKVVITDALTALDPAMHHDEWIAVGMAIHNAYAGAVEGLRLWAEWSSKSDNPEHLNCNHANRWNSFTDDPSRGNVGFPTLLKMARDAGWGGDFEGEVEEVAVDVAFYHEREYVSGAFMEMLDEHRLTKDEIDQFAEPTWLVDNLVIKGHLSAFPAPANGGKTLLFMELARELASDNLVVYINMDISGVGSKRHWKQAEESGIHWVTPDLKGSNINKLMSDLYASPLEDLKHTVIIIDTLKKLTDMIDKRKSKSLYKSLRRLTSKGATVICLCHTNKYKDADDNLIYEGTGDLRSDVDNMIYLEPFHEGTKLRSLSTRPDKVRGAFEPITFEFDDDRRLSVADEFTDTNILVQIAKDQQYIDEVSEAIEAGSSSQMDIVKFMNETYGRNAKRVRRILADYGGEFAKVKTVWNMERLSGQPGRPIVYSAIVEF
jgi:hypothetical protein